MPDFRPALPDCDLLPLIQGPVSAADARALLCEGGKACARYVREGGRLSDIRWEECVVRQGRIHLLPTPTGPRTLYPDRRRLEADLEDLGERRRAVAPTPLRRLRFLLAFTRELAREDPAWRSWPRCEVRRRQRDQRDRARYRFMKFHAHSAPDRELEFNGLWVPDPALQPEALRRALDDISFTPGPAYHRRRAEVVHGQVLGQETVVKRFGPNPKAWRRRWEVSRARRAWAGACTLQELGIPCTYPLGWLECRENGRLRESFFISRKLPAPENGRVWLRRVLPCMSPGERGLLRHRLRREIDRLHRHGLSHQDLKLSNLMVRDPPGHPPVFYWIDLEDLRPDGPSRLTFLRNLYQLNGSLPRQVTREERVAFARGFQHRFPFATHPWILALVERKTRLRLRRELRRLRGP